MSCEDLQRELVPVEASVVGAGDLGGTHHRQRADDQVPCGPPRAEIAVPLPAAGPPFEQFATTPRALSALLCRIGPGGPLQITTRAAAITREP
jgi:hypothetical protein